MSSTLEHWGLQRAPFQSRRDMRFFFRSAHHAEALARMHYLARDGGMLVGMLTGEVGCGKTLTAARLVDELQTKGVPAALLEYADFTFECVLREILRQLGADASARSAYDGVAALRRFLARQSRTTVVVVDEAQLVTERVLDRLRTLTNLGEGSRLTLVLVGQPDLQHVVAEMPQLEQRVSLRFHLEPLSFDDTAAYLSWRLGVAGLEGDNPFEPAALRRIFQLSGAIPRRINRLAKLSLELGSALGRRRIDEALVHSVADDQGWSQHLR